MASKLNYTGAGLLEMCFFTKPTILLKKFYSLRPIILFANMDVSRHILVIDTSVFKKSNMGRREYKISNENISLSLLVCFLNQIEAI
jgi:hypothetical protein